MIKPKTRVASSEIVAPVFKERFSIYFLFDNLEVVYIGRSTQVEARVATHAREGKKIFTHANYYDCSSEKEMNEMEACEILFHLPKYNSLTPEITALGYTSASAFRLKYLPRPPVRFVRQVISLNLVRTISGIDGKKWFLVSDMEAAYNKEFNIKLNRIS